MIDDSYQDHLPDDHVDDNGVGEHDDDDSYQDHVPDDHVDDNGIEEHDEDDSYQDHVPDDHANDYQHHEDQNYDEHYGHANDYDEHYDHANVSVNNTFFHSTTKKSKQHSGIINLYYKWMTQTCYDLLMNFVSSNILLI